MDKYIGLLNVPLTEEQIEQINDFNIAVYPIDSIDPAKVTLEQIHKIRDDFMGVITDRIDTALRLIPFYPIGIFIDGTLVVFKASLSMKAYVRRGNEL